MSWRDRAPAMLQETLTGPRGEPCFTSTDRRWLWRIAALLVVNAQSGSVLDQLHQDLSEYLHESCEHHWTDYAGDEFIDPHRQCIWCNHVEWHTEGSTR